MLEYKLKLKLEDFKEEPKFKLTGSKFFKKTTKLEFQLDIGSPFVEVIISDKNYNNTQATVYLNVRDSGGEIISPLFNSPAKRRDSINHIIALSYLYSAKMQPRSTNTLFGNKTKNKIKEYFNPELLLSTDSEEDKAINSEFLEWVSLEMNSWERHEIEQEVIELEIQEEVIMEAIIADRLISTDFRVID